MGFDKVLNTMDLSLYQDWLDEDVVAGWMKCAEYLIYKHKYNEIVVKHKKLADGKEEDFLVEIRIRDGDTSKVPNTKQKHDIVEDAGIAMGLLVTQWLRPCTFIRVLKEGDGYDYFYVPKGSNEEELIEMTGTEIPGGGRNRLTKKIRNFAITHPESSGYISVSCFPDKIQILWGHRN
ncbi:MAG: hypothetical protein Q8M95_06940 [Candidatus Methanoperedens sp.]|nr:hypothetical protein [Candidatus Methanoperedens sp.]